MIQGLTRNPPTDPGLLGVNAGAAVFIVFAIGVLSLTGPGQYIRFGFLGATLAAVLVHGIGSLGREGATPVKPAGPRSPSRSPRRTWRCSTPT